MALPNPNSSGEFALRELIRQNEDAAHMRQQAFDTAKETLTIQKNIDKAQVYEGMKAGEDRKKRIQKPIQELTGTGNNKNISALNRKIKLTEYKINKIKEYIIINSVVTNQKRRWNTITSNE